VLEARPLDLNELVTGTLRMLSRIVGEDIRVEQKLTEEPMNIQADPGQIEQVLMNLTVNARDAMPDGGEIAVLTEQMHVDADFCASHPWARQGDYAVLVVSDTGTGMDSITQARIFEPFFTTKEMGRGTGLGLAVVYGIVKQHEGFIHLYSELGKGTTFRIYLPLQSGGVASAKTAATSSALLTGSETVLLVEDDASLRNATTRILEQLGYTVHPAAHAEAALKLLKEHGSAIQLALVDVVMPGMSGPQLYDHIQLAKPGLPFIFTTGYSPHTSQTEPIRTLPAQVLPKPYGLRALAQIVRLALDQKPAKV
jgi:CheY-like chemotaxis protein